MKRLKIAMMSMTHGHTRKYYDVLKNNPKLEWIAVSTANEEVKEIFLNSVKGIPCYDSDEAMLDAHPEIEAVVLSRERRSSSYSPEASVSPWKPAPQMRRYRASTRATSSATEKGLVT